LHKTLKAVKTRICIVFIILLKCIMSFVSI